MSTSFTAPEMVAYDNIAAHAYDEISLWSAPFGLKLLDTVELKAGMTVLDVGCGTGFPLIELSQRLGQSSKLFGVDPWGGALDRLRAKLEIYGIDNVTLFEQSAECLSLEDASVDLIVSNNGFNNIDCLDQVLAECARVARVDAQLVLTYTLPASMKEFYDTFDELLAKIGLLDKRRVLAEHIYAKRKPLDFTISLLKRYGFILNRCLEDSFSWHFVNAKAMFEHFFIRVAFLPAWLDIVDLDQRQELFDELAQRLDAKAAETGSLKLTIPFACLSCRRMPK